MQRALGEAIEMWLAPADDERRRKAFRAAKLRGFLADTGIDEMRARLRKEELEADRRRAGG